MLVFDLGGFINTQLSSIHTYGDLSLLAANPVS